MRNGGESDRERADAHTIWYAKRFDLPHRNDVPVITHCTSSGEEWKVSFGGMFQICVLDRVFAGNVFVLKKGGLRDNLKVLPCCFKIVVERERVRVRGGNENTFSFPRLFIHTSSSLCVIPSCPGI